MPGDDIFALNETFKRARENLEISLETVAENAKVETGFLELVENNQTPIVGETFNHLSEKGLGVPVAVSFFMGMSAEEIQDPAKQDMFAKIQPTFGRIVKEIFLSEVNQKPGEPAI